MRDTLTNVSGSISVPLGYRCASTDSSIGGGGAPAPIVLTQAEFAALPVAPLTAHVGPPGGWLPVNMDLVLYAESSTQELNTTLLGTPVAVRAIPTSYTWDLGDGTTITTTKPGAPFPSTDVAHRYRYEGWYDVTLTTTFAGQYSVAGGPWQTIDGTIDVTSAPVAIFSKSLESRLVNPDVPADEDADPWLPPRTPLTEGPVDADASHS